MANLLTCNQTKRRTRASLSSTESSGSPDLKKAKNLDDNYEVRTTQEEDEVLLALDMANELSSKMDDVLKKLCKLDSIEEAVNQIQNSLQKLQERTSNLEKFEKSARDDIKDLKTGMAFCDESVNIVTSQVNDFKKELVNARARNEELEVKLRDVETKVEDLKTKDLYLEAYSRRENIKFMNIDEVEDENVEEVLRTFLNNQLNYRQHDVVEIQRIHRNPARKDLRRGKPRPILVRFLRAKDCEEIMALGRNLKDTKYQMFVDLPNELVIRRRAQMSTFKLAKANKIPASFSKSEPDKLYIKGQLWPVGKTLIV